MNQEQAKEMLARLDKILEVLKQIAHNQPLLPVWAKKH